MPFQLGLMAREVGVIVAALPVRIRAATTFLVPFLMTFSVCSAITFKAFFAVWFTEDSTVPVFEAMQATATALLKDELLDFAAHCPDTSNPVPVGPPVNPSMRSLPDLQGRSPRQ
jgi:hypothetical protein